MDLKITKGAATDITVSVNSTDVTIQKSNSITVEVAQKANQVINIDRNIKGATGNDGLAATIAVGTTTTGIAGSNANVTNSGTSSAATFNFVIPQGIQGIQGVKGDTGATGATGAKGDTGATGAGVAIGGTNGQVLAKSSNVDYATNWINPTTGTVTSVGGTGSVNGITLSGTITSSGNLTLGGALSGIANSQLTNSAVTINGSSVSLGGSTNITSTPAGTTTQVQYNNGGVLAGSANMTFNGTSLTLVNGATIQTLTVGLGGGAVSTNTAVGVSALSLNTSGVQNYASGYGALGSNTSGTLNTALGYGTLSTNATSSYNTAVGSSALLNNTAGGNTAIGSNVLLANTTGARNIGVGGWDQSNNLKTLSNNISGNFIVGIGYSALAYNTTASNLVAIGYGALQNNTTNVATLGTITGGTLYTTGTYTGVVMTLSSGSTAITYPTATIVVAGGAVTTVTITSAGVGFKDTTTVLTAPAASIGGTGSGFSVPVATLASGINNTALGYRTLFSNTTGSANIAFGNQAGYGSAGVNANTTGSNNTYIGYQTVGSGVANTNEMVIGNNAVGLGSNTTVIGNSSTILTKTFGVHTSTNYTVATLPSASTSGVGSRAFVTDALAPVFGSTVVTGGAVAVPVYSDGTTWKVG